MDTLPRFKAAVARFRDMTAKAGRDPSAVTLAYRISSNAEAQPKGTVDGERKLFTGGAADFVGDIKALAEAGVTSFDSGMFAPTLGRNHRQHAPVQGRGDGEGEVTRLMRIGATQIGLIAPTSRRRCIDRTVCVGIITEGEALGFDYLTISDHIMVPRNLDSKYPYTDSGEFPAGTAAAWLEQLTTTAYIAALTNKLRFVLSVMVVPHRPAVLTAKILATIDYLSKGRLTLGIGVGWCREEFEAINAAPFDDRGHVTDEWMMACKELWSKDDPRFDGKYVKFSDVVFTPKPVQQPIPIWVGGESGPALRRTARYADGWYPVSTNPQFPMHTLSKFKAGMARFRGVVEKAGRDPSQITVALRVLGGPPRSRG